MRLISSRSRVSVHALAAGVALATCFIEAHASAVDRYVAPGGDDSGEGAQGAPWATLQHAADNAAPGDVVHVADGTYQGFHVETVASEGAPLVFSADGDAAIIDEENPVTADGINVENAAWITIEGFIVDGMDRAGIRVVESPHVTVRGNVTRDNFGWGILTGCAEDILIEENDASGSIDEHGIYHSNSADRAVIRNNVVHDNNANGIHINSDLETSCEGIAFDGIISDILVEGNLIWNQGNGGGSGINCDGVQSSIFRNNVIYEAHASGMSFYRIDGAEGARGNTVMNNTVVVAGDGRWALNFTDGSTDGFIRNNILFGASNVRGSIRVDAASLPGLDSDYNILGEPLTTDGDETLIDLAAWQGLGFDANSAVVDVGVLFVGPSDFHLVETSPARDAGDPVNYAVTDLDGNGRPEGSAPDIGAYEYGGMPATASSTGAGPATGVGGGDGDGDGDGGDGSGGDGDGDGGASSATNGAGPGANGANGATTATGVTGAGGGDGATDGEDDGCGCRLESSSAAPTGLARLSPLALLAGLLAIAARRRARARHDA